MDSMPTRRGPKELEPRILASRWRGNSGQGGALPCFAVLG